ncbi:MAG: hypothetical protein ABIU58_07140 [Ramlibacter sp.]
MPSLADLFARSPAWASELTGHWRDSQLDELGAGNSEIRRTRIGRELFAETK